MWTPDASLETLADRMIERRKEELLDKTRVGGDEFAVVLPNHATREAIAVAGRLRRAVHESPKTSRNLAIRLSFGVAEFSTRGSDAVSLNAAADAALYDAKRLGGNLVQVAGEAPSTVAPREPEPQ